MRERWFMEGGLDCTGTCSALSNSGSTLAHGLTVSKSCTIHAANASTNKESVFVNPFSHSVTPFEAKNNRIPDDLTCFFTHPRGSN